MLYEVITSHVQRLFAHGILIAINQATFVDISLYNCFKNTEPTPAKNRMIKLESVFVNTVAKYAIPADTKGTTISVIVRNNFV